MANTPITRPITSFTVPWGLLGPLTSAAPEDWAEVSYKASVLGSVLEHTLLAVDKAGITYRIGDKDAIGAAVHELRRAEYTPANGPWFGLTVTLKSDGARLMSRRYGAAPAFEQPVPDDAYAEDLRVFPREDAAIPDWLRQKAGLGEASAAGKGEPVPAAEAAPRRAKVFDSVDQATGMPLVSRPRLRDEEIPRVLEYLNAGPVFLFASSFDKDVYFPDNPPAVPLKFATDGTWIWSGAVVYYLEKYGLPPEPELLAHIRARDYALPEVSDAAKEAARDVVTGRGPSGPN
ncbi:hypothetical protein KDK95_02455 [Actinospica sp. MGRD01-02]|uniref:Uncharacterized protein n=1 Tax=Actinospica acidithermotolerans TaxID=2828514 RepID=A0A941E650_9ACTN|nr:hypothetical protein [Actinospica acidithermotolerans]MBR7825152.1 hypothetical protein [Actinospica acidithermotolerans]